MEGVESGDRGYDERGDDGEGNKRPTKKVHFIEHIAPNDGSKRGFGRDLGEVLRLRIDTERIRIGAE